MSNHSVKDANATWTTWSRHVMDWLKSPRGTVSRIQFLVVLVAIGMTFLATFGSMRRRSRNLIVQKGVLAVYVLSSSLVTYTLGSMQSSPIKSSMYPIWAISLYVLFVSADSITAYSLDDNSQLMRQAFQTAICIAYVGLIAVTISSSGFLIYLVFCLAFYAYFKFMQRLLACRMASASWDMNKMIADYMREEHRDVSSYDPVSMEGYRYPVDWSHLGSGTSYATELRAERNDVIDIEMLWRCNDMSLSQELKETCLSFSLFHLLRRRFFGFECGESSLRKTHDFVFRGLLARNEDGIIDYSRVFKVVEVELSFMYDFFFTKRAATYYQPHFFDQILSWCLILAATITAHMTASNSPRFSSIKNWANVATITTADVMNTVAILSCIVFLEFIQLFLYWTSNWARVYWACQYIRIRALQTRGGGCMRPKEVLTWFCIFMSNKYCWFTQKNKDYWQNKIGQYSLVESVRYNPNPSVNVFLKFLRWFALRILYIRHPVTDPEFEDIYRRNVNRPGKPIEFSAEVKEALVRSLERTQGSLTNGQSSLVSNSAHRFLWACRHNDMVLDSGTSSSQKTENQARLILTWHIATCYCEMATLKYLSPRPGGELKFNLDVATKLSRYCAYLVVSAPKLLPGHHYDTKREFDAVAIEAVELLQSDTDKYEVMRRLTESREALESEEMVFHKGVRLGKQLEEQELGACWKVLADFWSEMLIYIAPSDNVKEHIECLANGGELVTCLWALLSHAGILKRKEHQEGGV